MKQFNAIQSRFYYHNVFRNFKLLLSIVCFCLIGSLKTYAQVQTIQWQKALGGSNWDIGRAIINTSDGGSLVVGDTRSTDGDVSANHSGNNDVWVVKLSPTGTIQWEKSYGGAGEEIGFHVIQTSDGGYIIAARTNYSDGDVTGTHGGEDVWIVKISSTGILQWQRAYGGTGNDNARSIVQLQNGSGYVFIGYTESNDGDVSGNHGGSRDAWIVKIDLSGNIVWQECLGGSGDDRGVSLIEGGSGFVAACYSSSGDGDATGGGCHGVGYAGDYWVLDLNTSGGVVWQKMYGGYNTDYVSEIIQTSYGDYAIMGKTYAGDGDLNGLGHGNDGSHGDLWLLRIQVGGAGTIHQNITLGSTGDDWGSTIIQAADGDFVLYGQAGGSDGDVSGGGWHGDADYWMVKISSTNTIRWQKCFGGPGAEWAGGLEGGGALIGTSDGGYIMAGYINANGGDVTGYHGGQFDMWVVKSIAPAITTSVMGSTFCPGGPVSVPYTTTGTYTAGNVFTAQLSNASGSFSSPTSIGNLTSVTSGTISATIPGSTAAGSGYRIRVVSSTPVITGTNNSNLSVESNPCFTWGGTSSTVWATSSNWVPTSVPTATDNVVIPPGAPNYPYLTGNLTHNARITIDGAANLKIDGILTNNGTIIVNSGGSLLQTSGSTLAGTGTFNVKRAVPNLTSFISSPINNESVFSFGITPTGTPGGQIIPNGCNPNNVSSSSPYGNLLELRENPTVLGSCAQSLWFVKSTGNMTNGRGYSLRNGPITLNYTGTVNNGTITYSGLTRQSGTIADGDGSTPTRGWHLVGNPYPSPITLNSGDLGAGFDNQIAIYNNGVWISHTLSVSPVTVAVGQGFEIRNSTPGTSPNFSLTNSLRTAANPTFYRQGLLIDHYMNVYLNNGSQSDQTMVYFMDGATDNFDPMFDANRMSDDIDLPMVYTVVNAERLSYNALPKMAPGETKSVPMGIRTEVPGNHTLSFSDLLTLENTSVTLEDLKLGSMQPVSEGYVYSFVTQTGDARERFVLHFAANTASAIMTLEKSAIPVYSFGNAVYIDLKELRAEEQFTAIAYDLAGRVLFKEEVKGGGLFTKVVGANGSDLVIVSLRNQKGETFRTKLFLSQNK
jgi:hypothetical protein